MGNPFLDRQKQRGKNGHGKISEKRVGKAMGARMHPNSGAKQGAKSDASLHKFRVEMKSTVTDTLPVQLAWLAKITQEALPQGQHPAVILSFVDAEGRPRLRQYAEWVLIPQQVFQDLVEFVELANG